MGCDAVGGLLAFGDRELGSGVGHVDAACDEPCGVVAVGCDRTAVEAGADLLGPGNSRSDGCGVGSVAVVRPSAEVGIGRIADRGELRRVRVRYRVAVSVNQGDGDRMGGDAVGGFLAFGDREFGSGVVHVDAAGGEAGYVVARGLDRSTVEAGGDLLVAGDGGGDGCGVGAVAIVGPAAESGIGRIADCDQFRGVGVDHRVAVFIDQGHGHVMGSVAVGNPGAFSDRELRAGIGHIDAAGDETSQVVAFDRNRGTVECRGDGFGSGHGRGDGGGVSSVAVVRPSSEAGIGRVTGGSELCDICIQNRAAGLVDQGHRDGVGRSAVSKTIAVRDSEAALRRVRSIVYYLDVDRSVGRRSPFIASDSQCVVARRTHPLIVCGFPFEV